MREAPQPPQKCDPSGLRNPQLWQCRLSFAPQRGQKLASVGAEKPQAEQRILISVRCYLDDSMISSLPSLTIEHWTTGA